MYWHAAELGDFIKDATKDRHFSIAIAASSEVTGRDDNAEPFTIPVRVRTWFFIALSLPLFRTVIFC